MALIAREAELANSTIDSGGTDSSRSSGANGIGKTHSPRRCNRRTPPLRPRRRHRRPHPPTSRPTSTDSCRPARLPRLPLDDRHTRPSPAARRRRQLRARHRGHRKSDRHDDRLVLAFTILCTSRTPLDLSDEAIMSLSPLEVRLPTSTIRSPPRCGC
ncbi:MAG: hypothetical protein R2697_00995 [Ilumatobacteraceae bacterium]